MHYRERVDAIAARLAALPGSGSVHNRRRFSGNWMKYLQLFANEDGGIYGWTASRRNGSRGESSTRWVEEYQLTRVVGVRDADETEIGFQESLDRAVAEFRDHPDLGFGEVVDGELAIEEVYDTEVGAVLAHVGVCKLQVSFYIEALGGEE